MAPPARQYRLGDLLALARRSWVRQMSEGLARRGFEEYRVSDAATLRLLRRGAVPVGRLGEALGVSRQAARKVAAHLEERGYAQMRDDPADARRRFVALTEAGAAYAVAVTEVIHELNRRVAARVDVEQLAAADAVLRACIEGELRQAAARIATPEG